MDKVLKLQVVESTVETKAEEVEHYSTHSIECCSCVSLICP